MFYFSPTRNNSFANCTGCTLNNTNRCNGISTSLTINGDNQICASSSELYTLSSGTSYPITWSITSGSGLVSYNTNDPYEINISNSSNTGFITLNANLFGCLSFNKVIALGAPVIAYDGYLMAYSNKPGHGPFKNLK